MLGIKGNEWAWRNKKWVSVEEFKQVKRSWAKWGLILLVVLPIALIFLLALYGLYYAIYDKKWKYFVIWFFIVLLLLFFYNITGLSFFVRRAHMIYLALISLVPLSAVGFYNLMIYIKCKLENKSLHVLVLCKIIIIFLILFFIFL